MLRCVVHRTAMQQAASVALLLRVRRASMLGMCPYHTSKSSSPPTPSSPASLSSCPMSSNSSSGSCVGATNSASNSPTAMAMLTPEFCTPQLSPTLEPHCPVVGTTPTMRCPVESHNAMAMQQRRPSLMQMVQSMGKSQLSAYVAATALAGFVIGGGLSPVVGTAVTLGTLLQSYSANTANQVIEAPYDKLMKRTCRRMLPMRFITSRAACGLSALELALGTGVLYLVSPAAAALGVVNWGLYVCMYTPLKRVSALNTWFGSIVGGVPPLMGGLAAAPVISGPVWLLGALLFVWQIPHFNGLAFHCRRDYEAAGFKMLAFYNPWRASFYAVLLSVVMAFLTLVGPAWVNTEVEALWYYPVTAAANAVMIYKAVLFHREPLRHCRGCFVFSYVYLSIVLAAVMLNHVQPLHLVEKAQHYFAPAAEDVERQQQQQQQAAAAVVVATAAGALAEACV